MDPQIIQEQTIILAGMSFYGDPFVSSDPWSEENQIGRLWQRLMKYIEDTSDTSDWNPHRGPYYEVHIYGPETEKKGLFEVFVGFQVSDVDQLPYNMVAKVLPAASYAVFTLKGRAIIGDWEREILGWLDENGYREAYPFNFQYYDERYKGLDPVDESVIDIYIPVEEI